MDQSSQGLLRRNCLGINYLKIWMIKVLIHSDSRYPVNRKLIRQVVLETLDRNGMENIDAEVSIAVIGQRKMKKICQKYLGDAMLHEVLSFPLEDVDGKRFVNPPDEILHLGDVVLCWPQVLEAARDDGVMVDEELMSLVSHGALHLIGKHHE